MQTEGGVKTEKIDTDKVSSSLTGYINKYSIMHAEELFADNPDKSPVANMLNRLANDKNITDKERARAAIYISNELNNRLHDTQSALHSCRDKWDTVKFMIGVTPNISKIKKFIFGDWENTNYKI